MNRCLESRMLEIKATQVLLFGNDIQGMATGVNGSGMVKNKIIGGEVDKEI